MIQIGPSLMCADLGRIEDAVRQLDLGGVDYFHIDIMDGRFVPNITLGIDFIKTVRQYTTKPLDVHLMVEEPEKFIDLVAEAGADMISVHAESKVHLQRALTQIKRHNLQAGVALNPSTPLCHLDYVMDVLDYVCVMTVNPGYAGQPFISSMLQKIDELKRKIEATPYTISIQVDGNISPVIIPQVVEKGAEMLVCGTSSLFLPNQSLKDTASSLKQKVIQLADAI